MSENRSSIESVARSKRAREQIQAKSNMPSQLLESAEVLVDLLEDYYKMMNMKDFTYPISNQRYSATVITGKVVFEAPPNVFFFDLELLNTILIDSSGNEVDISVTSNRIGAGNNVPEIFALEGDDYGATFEFDGLTGYENTTLTLITRVVVYAGDQPSRVISDLNNIRDLNDSPDKYLDLIHGEYASGIPLNLTVDRILLYKNLVQFYRERGSQNSIETFFRLLFGDVVSIYYPQNDMLVPSSGNWDKDIDVPVYNNNGAFIEFKKGKYLDKGGFLSDIKKIQDSFFYQKFSYVIRTGTNIEKWENAFNKIIHPSGFKFFGEIAIIIYLLNRDNAVMPDLQPGFIGLEDIPYLIELYLSLPDPSTQVNLNNTSVDSVDVLNSGYIYRTAPTVTFSPPDLVGGVRATGTVNLDSSGRVLSIDVTDGGSGYINTLQLVFTGKRDRIAEFLLTIIIVTKNRDNDYKSTLAERWNAITKFFDNTPMHAYEDYIIGELEDGITAIYTNVGTEIYSQTVTATPSVADTNTKINSGYI